MSNQIAIERVVYGFKLALVETFEEVRGMYLDKGMSMFETLDKLTAEQASRPVTEDCATIAAHVAHTRFYLDVLHQALLDKEWRSDVDWDEIWRTTSIVTPEEWMVIRTMLRESYDRIIKEMDNYESWEGDHELSALLGILVHSAYHLGEIQQATCFIKYLQIQDAAQDAG
jgi:hypothetical protein